MINNCIICDENVWVEKFPNSQELPNWKFRNIQYFYVECQNCNILRINELPSNEILKDFYNEVYNYKSFAQGAFWKKIQAYLRMSELRKYVTQNNKILDFGCGHGYFVRKAGEDGYKSYGFDIGSDNISSDKNVSITYNYNFDNYKEDGFDLITAWHVIEHLANPLEMLQKLNLKLNKGGYLAIAVPNRNSLGIYLCGEKWSWVQQPLAHVHHYNANNLSALLTKAGFAIEKVSTRDTEASNIFDVLITKLFFSNRSRGSLGFSQSNGSNVMFHAVNIIRILFLPFSFIHRFYGKNNGAELMVVARKV